MSSTDVKVPMVIRLYAGDVLVAEVVSPELFNFALDYALKFDAQEGAGGYGMTDNTAEQLRASSLETVVAFLLGEAELDGVWFGDKNTRRKGAFWWREYLREAFEFGPIAWESTTPVYFKYVTQAKYEKFSPAVRQWYKPYRCTDCANTRADSGEAVAWRYRHAVEPYGWTTFISKARAELLRVEGYIVEPLFTHPSATALDSLHKLVEAKFRSGNSIQVERIVITRSELDALSQRVEKGND